MMTQTYTSNHAYSPIFAMNPFSGNESAPHMHHGIKAEKTIPARKTEGRPMKNTTPENKNPRATQEMPLWPSLAKIQPETGKAYPWKQQIKEVLQCRSVFIGTVMTMAGLGLMLIV
ncbi:MAG: hypothetical protein SWH61_06700 [Thermodesulfobacteriota bacterium]|nr:hypothetical protein [Thermodesulfobacteriota bacterium]